MKEHPILFSALMVRAILEGRKTVTRRIVKDPGLPCATDAQQRDRIRRSIPCPYGQPGDRLWVRETCRAEELTLEAAERDGFENGDGVPLGGLGGVRYLADNWFRPIDNTLAASDAWGALYAYRSKSGVTVPPIHMPRWASRITLEVTGVRVERLQDISVADAMAEGVDPAPGVSGEDDITIGLVMSLHDMRNPDRKMMPAPVARFVLLWDSINGKKPGVTNWNANPLVWVVEFKRVLHAES